MRKVYTPPFLPRSSVPQVLGALAITLMIFLILPLTQLFSSLRKEMMLIRPIEVVIPPPPPPPKQPPPEEKKPEEKPELKDKPKPLTLSQLDLVLNPGTGGALLGDFGLGFQMLPDTVAEMKIFELYELDKQPQVVYQAPPSYPIRLLRDRISGSVVILFVVDETGKVRDARVKQGSFYKEFEESALTAVMNYRFTPGIKDGQPVRAWFEVPINFQPGR